MSSEEGRTPAAGHSAWMWALGRTRSGPGRPRIRAWSARGTTRPIRPGWMDSDLGGYAETRGGRQVAMEWAPGRGHLVFACSRRPHDYGSARRSQVWVSDRSRRDYDA